MCWYHLKANIKKHAPSDFKEEINLDILQMHLTKNENEFKEKWYKIEKKWKNLYLTDFLKYFQKQWISSCFSNWQIYHSEPGFATTNNPLEQYNRFIKAHFTNYLSMNIIPALEIFIDLIDYDSKQTFFNYNYKIVSNSMIPKSKTLKVEKF